MWSGDKYRILNTKKRLSVNEHKLEKEKNVKYHTCEFRYGKYQRTISFDSPIKPDESTAEYRNGILNISIPKVTEKEAKSHKLTIS